MHPGLQGVETIGIWEGIMDFVEPDCDVGGTMCPAWDKWLDACLDADPESIDEERDPKPLASHRFDPALCARPERCTLHGKACAGNEKGEKK